MKKIIIPSIIAKSQGELDEILFKIAGNATLLQLDIMDGRFVPNHSLDFDFKLPEREYCFEAHLMIQKPEEWIEKEHEAIEVIIPHFEALRSPEKIIQKAKERKKKIGFALNPETELEGIEHYLQALDQVLVMTVKPGFYGSPFLPETLEKVRKLRMLRPELEIEVDGGINPRTIALAEEAGANKFVCGSFLIQSENLKERMALLKKIIRQD